MKCLSRPAKRNRLNGDDKWSKSVSIGSKDRKEVRMTKRWNTVEIRFKRLRNKKQYWIEIKFWERIKKNAQTFQRFAAVFHFQDCRKYFPNLISNYNKNDYQKLKLWAKEKSHLFLKITNNNIKQMKVLKFQMQIVA